MYHWDEARPQLRMSSTFVVKTVSGRELIKGFIPRLLTGSSPDLFYPIQISLDPGVNQPKKKNADEKQNLNQSENTHSTFNPAPEHRGNGEEKSYFHLEDNKDQRYEVKTDVK